MAFHDARLPDDIERGAQGGPLFKTTVLELASGFEQRNINWADAKGRWDASYGVQNKVGYTRLINHFRARRGRAYSFPFKDWSDFQMARQIIGVTDGATATFQIFKNYVSGPTTVTRELTKPVTGTTSVWVNDAAITIGAGADQAQVARLTGIVTLGATLAAQTGTNVEVQTEFDVPVRYDTDQLDIRLDWEQAGDLPATPVIEVLGE